MAQRKTSDDVILQLFREGKTQKEIAEHFKVSPVAIYKRLKRILPKPQSLEKLTDKEQNFVVAVAGGKSRTQAVMESFDVSSRGSAKAMQNALMEKDDVKVAIAELMQIYGLTRGYRINKLKSHVDHVDPGISLKGLDMSFKLDGSFAPEKHLVGILNLHTIVESLERQDREQRAKALVNGEGISDESLNKVEATKE